MAKLITDISEVQKYIRVSNALQYPTLEPSLNEVEMQELTFYLSEGLLAEIIAEKNAGTYTPRIEKIAEYVIAAEASLAVYKGAPEIEVMISDNGINRSETQDEKTAYGGQIKRLRNLAANRAYMALDTVLRTLEAYEQDYPEWQNAGYYALKGGMFIRSVNDFEKSGENIKGSALTFQALVPIMKDIQEQRIMAAMPMAMYEEILTQLDTGTLTTDNKYLLAKYLKPAIAKLTIQEALTALAVDVDAQGIQINQLELAGDSRTQKSASMSAIEKKAWSVRGRGEFYLSNMKEYLNENASDSKYPLWFNSGWYSETLKAQIERDSLLPSERKIYRG
ncbi:hypothetical protein DN752_21110 [Echinicola strongylocentroti]|uniref:Uncharacterized protein n=1 Tax=Echinicola strongylocentroti TaxID=1795355 RepID=A0A2Z4IQ74_9BACT|nr:DUF6712 family protein [Echinicola strongylocentroti]AWW32443.1 hypothetical protein DN752_21110 [Echinicola strongylocentroti]